jgi:hypothetical protein
VYALDASSGSLKWKYKTDEMVQSSPAVSGGIVYVGSSDDYVYALDANTGSLKWKYKIGDWRLTSRSSPAVSGGIVYVGSYDNYVYALDASSGSLKWKYKTDERVESSPAVSGGVVYVGSSDGYVYALDASSGSLKWKYKIGAEVHSSPAVSGGVVYVGSEDFYIYAFAPTPTPTTGTISVSSTPSGASIYLDGSYQGKTPITIPDVSAGSHTIKLTYTYYNDWSHTILVSVGNTSYLSAELTELTPTTPTPTTGFIVLSSTPSGASIYLDGSYHGKTPKTIPDVSAGSHYIELKLEGYNLWSDRINVMTGSTSYISVQLITTATIPTITPTYTILPTPIPSSTTASVNLHGEKTDVVLGEDILLKLSAVNLITKPKMHVQVIIIPPSGMSVTSSEFSKSGAGQFTANYELEPGDGRDIEVRIKSNQVGDFNVKGRIVYYFGEDKEKAEDHTLNLPIKVRKEPVQTAPSSTDDAGTNAKTPGFEGMIAAIAFLLVLFLKRNR